MRIAVIEDDPQQALLLMEFIEQFSRETSIPTRSIHFACGDDFLAAFSPEWDLALLDMEMPGTNGMQTARRIRERDEGMVIIFVTQIAQFAIEGYEVGALDYILKPVDYAPFALKLRRAARTLEARDQYIVVANQTGKTRVALHEIVYIEVRDHTLEFHLTDKVIRSTSGESISKLSETLAASGFARCHQKYLVNTRHVNGYGKSTVNVANADLPLSRTFAKSFIASLLETWKG